MFLFKKFFNKYLLYDFYVFVIVLYVGDIVVIKIDRKIIVSVEYFLINVYLRISFFLFV